MLYKEKEYFSTQGCRIYYLRRPEMETAQEKLEFLHTSRIEYLFFDRLIPDKNNNWINLSDDNDWDALIPIADKLVKSGKSKDAIFEIFSLGASTNRDEWVIDFNKNNLDKKLKFFFNHLIEINNRYENDNKIKWSRNLKRRINQGLKEEFEKEKIISLNYRPFVKQYIYDSNLLIDEISCVREIFSKKNLSFASMGISTEKPFTVLGTNRFTDLNFLSPAANGCRIYSLYRYNKSGNRNDNITDWGLEQFVNHFQDDKITKENIFHYTYAVLHNPAYRKKYYLNLKREFPRLPFYKDFHQWAAWGKALMDLHINYETVEPFNLIEHKYGVKAEAKRQKEMFSMVEEPEALFNRKPKVKVKLKADKTAGIIDIDELTFLTGVPAEAWEYKLGNRSALEWILDQYKEKKPSDPTIAEKFNTYRFADYKEKVIDLLKRVCTVSAETVNIVKQMELAT